MRTARRLALALLPLVATLPASATSYLPMTDEALVDQAPVIAVVEVQGSGSGQDGARPFTGYRVRVERVLKGAMASGLRITVRVPGGARADGLTLRIWGAPRFVPGERALLFLSPRLDGTYGILHLMLGAFHEVRADGHRLALRDLSEAHTAAPGEAPPAEPLRDFDRFVRWIAARARGMRVRADYQVAAAPGLRQVDEEFTLLGGVHQRWLEFDDGASVAWYAHQGGQPGLAGGGFTEFQTALAAWNDDPDSNVAYTYAGTTTTTNGFTNYDTVNAIIFEDPNGEASGSFSCSGGGGSGVLAIGGTWSDDTTTPAQIVNADIVTNNGVACYFQNSNGSKRAEQLFAHEIGHTLGIGHSCGSAASGPCHNSILDQALMRAIFHNDLRGAALHADDRAAVAYLYGSPPPPRDFYTLVACRLLDTRDPDGAYGGPMLSALQSRIFLAPGRCGIPSTAVALSINITVVSPSSGGYLTLFPTSWPQPNTNAVSFSAGQTRANNMLLFLSGAPERAFTVFAGIPFGTVHVVVDVNGYFE
jgi:hypothetical protein